MFDGIEGTFFGTLIKFLFIGAFFPSTFFIRTLTSSKILDSTSELDGLKTYFLSTEISPNVVEMIPAAFIV